MLELSKEKKSKNYSNKPAKKRHHDIKKCRLKNTKKRQKVSKLAKK